MGCLIIFHFWSGGVHRQPYFAHYHLILDLNGKIPVVLILISFSILFDISFSDAMHCVCDRSLCGCSSLTDDVVKLSRSFSYLDAKDVSFEFWLLFPLGWMNLHRRLGISLILYAVHLSIQSLASTSRWCCIWCIEGRIIKTHWRPTSSVFAVFG